jgi:hypothetical protein
MPVSEDDLNRVLVVQENIERGVFSTKMCGEKIMDR